MRRIAYLLIITAITIAFIPSNSTARENPDVWDRVTHRYADNDGIRIHYVTLGKGPLIVMIHGFPDFWYLWRDYIDILSDDHQVVAIDQRGYNRSDKPKGVDSYIQDALVSDVEAVIRHTQHESATVVGHDWGGFVAWTFAMQKPEMTDKLVIFNLPHPRGLRRELAHNRQQKQNSAYARRFQIKGAHLQLSAEGLARFGRDQAETLVHQRYLEAFERSDFEAMLNYYKANYPTPPYLEDDTPVIKIGVPVLQFHGLKDGALLQGMLNDTWDWVAQDLTLVTLPDAGHWAVTEKADFAINMMQGWLTLQATQ